MSSARPLARKWIYTALLVMLLVQSCVSSPNSMVDYLENKTISIDYGFAGNGISIEKINGTYYLVREIYGSGVASISKQYHLISNPGNELKIVDFDTVRNNDTWDYFIQNRNNEIEYIRVNTITLELINGTLHVSINGKEIKYTIQGNQSSTNSP